MKTISLSQADMERRISQFQDLEPLPIQQERRNSAGRERSDLRAQTALSDRPRERRRDSH